MNFEGTFFSKKIRNVELWSWYTIYIALTWMRSHCTKKWSLPLRTSSVNVTKSTVAVGVFIKFIYGVIFRKIARSWSAKDSRFSAILRGSGDLPTLCTLSGPSFLLLPGAMRLIKNVFTPLFYVNTTINF